MLETVNTEEEEEEPPAMKYPGVIPLSEMNTDFRLLILLIRKEDLSNQLFSSMSYFF